MAGDPTIGIGGSHGFVRGPEEESANALAPYLHAVRSHRLLLILVVLVAAGAAVAWAATRTLTYQATAEMLVNPLPQTDTTFLGLPLMRDTGDPTTTIQTAAALVDSPQARQLTASRLGVGWTADRVHSNVSVQPQGQSNILDVTATAHSAHAAATLANTFAAAVIDTRAARLRPLVAAAIASATTQLATIKDPASAVAASLQDRLSQLQGAANGTDPTLSFSEAASTPRGPAGPSSALVIALAVLAGLILGAGVALAIEWLRPRRLGSEEEVARLIHAPVLTQIPSMPRRLRHEGPAAALDPPRAVREAIRNLRVQLEVLEANGSIMITSGSKGDGKTTLSIALACEFAAAGREVILVDADFRKPDLGPALGVEPRAGLEKRLGGSVQDLSPALVEVPKRPGLKVLPAWPGEGPRSQERRTEQLQSLIRLALTSADYLILDTPPLGEAADALRLVSIVDYLVVVSRLGNTREAALETVRDLLVRTGRAPDGIVINGSTHATGGGYYYHYAGTNNRGAA